MNCNGVVGWDSGEGEEGLSDDVQGTNHVQKLGFASGWILENLNLHTKTIHTKIQTLPSSTDQSSSANVL